MGWPADDLIPHFKPPKKGPSIVELTNRTVIADKLLTALTEQNVVAVVLSEEDTDMLIQSLTLTATSARAMAFLLDLKQLRRSAFHKV